VADHSLLFVRIKSIMKMRQGNNILNQKKMLNGEIVQKVGE
jgi:hypothetical protein